VETQEGEVISVQKKGEKGGNLSGGKWFERMEKQEALPQKKKSLACYGEKAHEKEGTTLTGRGLLSYSIPCERKTSGKEQ